MTDTGEPVPMDGILNLTRTLELIQAQALRSYSCDPGHSVFNAMLTDTDRLAILVEAVGDIACTLASDGDTSNFSVKLTQVAAVAATWIEFLTTR